MQVELTKNAEQLLVEIIEHRNQNGVVDLNYWSDKFNKLSSQENLFLRSSFKELSDAELIKVMWASNAPYHMTITSKGTSYYEEIDTMKTLDYYSPKRLLHTARDIYKTEYKKPPQGVIGYDYISGPKYNKWIADMRIMQTQLSDKCPLKQELGDSKYYTKNSAKTFSQVIGLLESLVEWSDVNGEDKNVKVRKQYDVFLSHANADKLNYVDELYDVLNMLGVRIFYDKTSLTWGDNWKNEILKGTASSEFAIIVISENFFDREWTERELSEFLTRQNESGQKIVLPLLYKTTPEKMSKKYPSLGEIQAISTEKYSKENIVILFAKELIKRLNE